MVQNQNIRIVRLSMCTKLAKNKLSSNSRRKNSASLDTLEQLVTNSPEPPKTEDKLVFNKGTRADDKKTLQKRARRKYMSTGLALRLVDAHKQNPDSILKKSYWNTYHCCNQLAVMESGKVKSHYCKNRWCLVCNSIRTAQLIIKYRPYLNEWDKKVMVTLTRGPRCKGAELKAVIEEMQFIFNQIRKTFNQRYKRGKSEKFVGLRKMECTYDPKTNTYHPHYHLILKSPVIAQEFMIIWLKKHPKANKKAQDIRAADDNSVIEVFKYFTKVITKTKNGERAIYADAMDVIFNAIRGKRTFQNFGFKVGKVDFTEEEINEVIDELAELADWDQDTGDWIVQDTGELFSGYSPGDNMRELVGKKIVVRTGYDSS